MNLLHCPPEHLCHGADHTDEADHFVQFYEKDEFLVESVAQYVGDGFRNGQSVIVIATQDHRDRIETVLENNRLHPAAARAQCIYFTLDAAETLARFMVNGVPNERLFNETVGGLVKSATSNGRRLKAFGEMVALLWAEGNQDGAIELESLWNKLMGRCSFSLFCAYPLSGFHGVKNGQPFLHVCKEHSRVIPAESYSARKTEDERLQTISILQQKAASLEAEIAERRKIEEALARRERELSDLLENAAEAIHQVSVDGIILWANRAELELLGYTASEYIGRPITDFHADPPVIADIPPAGHERLRPGTDR